MLLFGTSHSDLSDLLPVLSLGFAYGSLVWLSNFIMADRKGNILRTQQKFSCVVQGLFLIQKFVGWTFDTLVELPTARTLKRMAA